MRPHAAAEAILRHALTLPGTHEDHPWGEVVAKVKGKVFVFFGRRAEPVLRFSVKLPVSGARWLDQEFAEPSAYGMGPHGWVTFTFDTENVLGERELCALVDESYRAVAPKGLLAQLDGTPPKGVAPRKKTPVPGKKPARKKAVQKPAGPSTRRASKRPAR